MDIRIITSHHNAHKAEGLAVVVDVVRAFTTACYILKNGARAIIPVGEVDAARAIKKQHPSYVLLGERMGIKQPGFDYGNSPAEIAHVDFRGKTVVMTTTAGIQGIVKAKRAGEIITGAFVNAGAVIRYIKRKNPGIVSFICTGDRGEDTEDFLCADYMRSHLQHTPIPFATIKAKLEGLVSTKSFLESQLTPYAREDLDRCFRLDTFRFVVAQTVAGGQMRLIGKEWRSSQHPPR